MRALLDVSLFGFAYTHSGLGALRTGIYRVVEQTAVALAERPDVDVTLCATEHHDATHTFVETDPRLRAQPFASDRRAWGTDAIRRAIVGLERRGAPRPLAMPLRAARRVLRGLRRDDAGPLHPESQLSRATLERADVYHSTLSPIPAVVKEAPGLRRFLTVYDVLPILHPELVWEGGDRWNRAMVDSVGPDDFVLAISQRTKDDLLEVRPELDPGRVFVAPLAADPEQFYPCDHPERLAAVRRRYGIPDGPYVLSLGSLVPHKNLPQLVRAFADLVRAERVRDLRLVLTGGRAWNSEVLDAELARLGPLRDRVVLTGYVDDADLAPLYSGAEVFVFPSLYEGFGLPPLEAMQCGTPVITSDRGALPEVVGGAGLMVDPRDGDALAQALLDVHTDAGLRADLARRSLARAAEFSWQRCAADTVAAYRAAVAGRAAPAPSLRTAA